MHYLCDVIVIHTDNSDITWNKFSIVDLDGRSVIFVDYKLSPNWWFDVWFFVDYESGVVHFGAEAKCLLN